MNGRQIVNAQAEGEKLFSLPLHIMHETARGSTPVPISTLAFEKGWLFLDGAINGETGTALITLLYLANGRRLKLFINSPGGEVTAGLAIVDAIRAYPGNIDIYCTGIAASMGAVILASGRKGHRFVYPHAKVMIHEPLIAGGLGGSTTSIQRTAQSMIETRTVLNGMLAEFTGRTVEDIDRNTAFDNYFTAEQAIDFGLCDEISEGFGGIAAIRTAAGAYETPPQRRAETN